MIAVVPIPIELKRPISERASKPTVGRVVPIPIEDPELTAMVPKVEMPLVTFRFTLLRILGLLEPIVVLFAPDPKVKVPEISTLFPKDEIPAKYEVPSTYIVVEGFVIPRPSFPS